VAESVEKQTSFLLRKGIMKNLKNNPALPGIVLVVVALVAIVWANSPLASSYDAIKSIRLAIPFLALDKPLELWVNDLLMAIFFLLVGLELKKEIIKGELSNPRRASLAIFAALGGMLAPAVIFGVFNLGSSGAPGWGIPMATDIAFAVGVLSLLGSRVPLALKIFLTALAVVDDMGAVLVIAVFYTSKLDFAMLGLAALLLAVLWGLNATRVRALPIYLGLGLVLWYAVLKSGLHATIAGVLLASTIPLGKNEHSPLETLEHAIKDFVTFFVMPVFAFFNAGVAFNFSNGISQVTVGVFLGLVLGKPLGITLFSWLAVRFGLAELPRGANWGMVFGIGILGGIGFTMALFIANLAFMNSALLVDSAKLGILAASFVTALAGVAVLVATTPRAVQS
jgi:Na+:H+ antiporter, NhaA family